MLQYVRKYKKYILIALGVVLIALLAFSSNKGIRYIKKQETRLKNDITRLEDEVKGLKDSVTYFKNIDKELIITEKSYYYEYVREYNKRKKAEKALLDIRYLTFDRQYLDSLAKHIKYR